MRHISMRLNCSQISKSIMAFSLLASVGVSACPAVSFADTAADTYLVNNMRKMEKTVDMRNYNMNFTGDASAKEGEYIFRLQLKYPDLFYVSPAEGWLFYRKSNGDVTKIQVGYTMNSAKALSAKKKYTKAINSIVKKARKKSSRKAQVTVVNNEIKRIAQYDYTFSRKNRYNAYGALVEKRAVCNGYATAFKAVMDKLGIPNGYRFNKDRSHIWNTVKINGKTLNVDVTWNDTSNSNRYLLKKTHSVKSLR